MRAPCRQPAGGAGGQPSPMRAPRNRSAGDGSTHWAPARWLRRAAEQNRTAVPPCAPTRLQQILPSQPMDRFNEELDFVGKGLSSHCICRRASRHSMVCRSEIEQKESCISADVRVLSFHLLALWVYRLLTAATAAGRVRAASWSGRDCSERLRLAGANCRAEILKQKWSRRRQWADKGAH